MRNRPRVLATLEGYAVEGGYDRRHEPATCFNPTIALGRHAGPGDARELWVDYERVLDLVPGLGLDGVRVTVEWARIEPRPGHVDAAALARYRAALAHARRLGLWVTVALVDEAWPAWLGLEAWLLPWVEPVALAHARRVVSDLGGVLDAVVPFADETIVARGFLAGTAPPWRHDARADARDATAQVERISAALAADDVVGPLVVARPALLGADASSGELAALLDPSRRVSEVHVRSLVRGAGPTGSSAALVERREGEWHAVGAELLAALG